MRIPEPLKDEIQTLIDTWRRDILTGYPVDLPPAAPPSATETRRKAAIQLLTDSLHLKANAGGAIKQKIRAALELLGAGSP
jgi:hypothetical protein